MTGLEPALTAALPCAMSGVHAQSTRRRINRILVSAGAACGLSASAILLLQNGQFNNCILHIFAALIILSTLTDFL